MKKQLSYSLMAVASAALIALSGCGGSDAVQWNEGVFESSEEFKNRCQVPRSGSDILGNTFPDVQGSTLLENNWLRSWSNETYLWYNEIIDQNPANFSDTESYFDVLKTQELTPNGNAKDNFHFSQSTESYLQRSQSGVSFGYGLQWALISSTPPRELRVAFSQPNGAAAAVNLFRGAEVLEIDGVDVINANSESDLAILNAGISPSSEGETHTFLVRDLGATETRTVTMTSGAVAESAILANDVIQTSSGNVGYVVYNTFQAFSEVELIDAFNQLESQDIQDLVLDLRYNGGGRLFIASELGYMIAGPTQTEGQTFEQIVYNDKIAPEDPVPFFSLSGAGNATPGVPLPSLNLSRVFILTTGSTCSASEAVINGLRGIDVEVILIGDTTCGKPYGFFPTDNCGTTYFTIQLTGVNAKGFGEYPDGFSPENTQGSLGVVVPGCSVADDFNHAFGDLDEALLNQALQFRETGTCSAPAIAKSNLQTAEKQANGLEIKVDSDPLGKIMIRSK
ncbi:S41 family peptidase [Aliikangiella marina]|nr:S41 family peptidase [Aliikangiella marina]